MISSNYDLLVEAMRLQKSGDGISAETLCREIIADDPKHADALHLLGVIQLQLGKPAEAAESIRQAIALEPSHAYYHANLGNALRALGEPSVACIEYRQALALSPGSAEIHNNLGTVLHEMGEFASAREHFQEALAIKPDLADLQYNLGNLARDEGDTDAAVRHYRRALELNIDYESARTNLARVLLVSGHTAEAIRLIRDTLSRQPSGSAGADQHVLLAHALEADRQPLEAERHYRTAIHLAPGHVQAFVELARLMHRQGRQYEALDAIEAGLKKAPGAVDLRLARGWLLDAMGELTEAETQFRDILKDSPNHPKALENLALIEGQKGQWDTAADLAEAALKADPRLESALDILAESRPESLGPDGGVDLINQRLAEIGLEAQRRAALLFTQARTLDRSGEYDMAFQAATQANRLVRPPYDRAADTTRFQNIRKRFDKQLFDAWAGTGNPSTRPVFVVGIPRSGTTLVHQILSRHPQVFGAGELPDIPNLAMTLPMRMDTDQPFPDCLEQLDQETLSDSAEEILDTLVSLGGDKATYIVDKMPHNFLYLGLIALLFPAARVIHCTRAPLDTGLSLYLRGLGPGHPYSFDLSDIAHFHHLYQSLMAHWKDTLPLQMIEVSYEQLVAHQEQQTRGLLKFLDLPWDSGCLSPEKSRSPIASASLWQARQPIHSSRVGHSAHYRKYLGPLREAMNISPE